MLVLANNIAMVKAIWEITLMELFQRTLLMCHIGFIRGEAKSGGRGTTIVILDILHCVLVSVFLCVKKFKSSNHCHSWWCNNFKVNGSFLKTTGYIVFQVLLFYEFDKLRNFKEDKHLLSHLSLGKSSFLLFLHWEKRLCNSRK